jgi:hypothetical protein
MTEINPNNVSVGMALVIVVVTKVDNIMSSTNVHVHRPPAVTLNETPEEFHISTGLR